MRCWKKEEITDKLFRCSPSIHLQEQPFLAYLSWDSGTRYLPYLLHWHKGHNRVLFVTDKMWCRWCSVSSSHQTKISVHFLQTKHHQISPKILNTTKHSILWNGDIDYVQVNINSTVTWCLQQCFSTARPRPGTGPWYQLYRAGSGSPGICHFSFVSNFHE